MNKKILIFSLITFLLIALTNFIYATDIVMNLNSANSVSNTNSATDTNTSPIDTNITANNTAIDNTIYSSATDTSTSTIQDEPTVTTTSDYEESGELSISNMINIVLIVVGIVLILLGIAIIIRLQK